MIFFRQQNRIIRLEFQKIFQMVFFQKNKSFLQLKLLNQPSSFSISPNVHLYHTANSIKCQIIILQLKLTTMNISPSKNTSPFRRPRVSFAYQNSPISYNKTSIKENFNSKIPNISHRPPPSPRILKQNTTTPLANKVSNFNTLDEDSFCECGKPSNYQSVKTKSRYCAQCGVKEMMKGGEVSEIISPSKQQNFNKSINLNSSGIRQPSRQMQIEQFLKEIEDEKNAIKKAKEESNQENKSVKNIYKERKVQLKAHYEKIKAAIKQSIDEDIRQIEEQEKEEKERQKFNQEKMEQNLQQLQKVQELLRQSKIKKLKEAQYSDIMNKYKLKTNQIIQNSRISSQTKHSSSQSQTSNENLFVYDPVLYRMVGKDKKILKICTENGVLFSFQGRQ